METLQELRHTGIFACFRTPNECRRLFSHQPQEFCTVAKPDGATLSRPHLTAFTCSSMLPKHTYVCLCIKSNAVGDGTWYKHFGNSLKDSYRNRPNCIRSLSTAAKHISGKMRKIYYCAFFLLFFFFTLKSSIILALSAFYSPVAVLCPLSVIPKIC